MGPIREEHLLAIVSLQQSLYHYCNELDTGATRIQDWFTPDCTFTVGGTTWHGREGVRRHYDDDAEAVKRLCEGGVKTVRHAMLNPRITVRDNGEAVVELIFLNFSAGGETPHFGKASPAVVADTSLVCRRDADGRWLIHDFVGTPLFFGDDPYMNTVLTEM